MKTTQRGFIVPLVILIIAALGIGGGIYYAEKAKKTAIVQPQTTVHTESTVSTDSSATVVPTTVTTTTRDTPPATSGSIPLNLTFEELLAYNTGKTTMCTGSFVAKGGTVKTTTYFNGNLIRGDSIGVSNGTTTTISAIIKGVDVYSWSGTVGTKITLNASFDLHAALSLANSGAGISPDQKGEYLCTPWTVDANKFVPPTSVQFTDYGSFNIPAVSQEMLDNMMKR